MKPYYYYYYFFFKGCFELVAFWFGFEVFKTSFFFFWGELRSFCG